jgi:Methyltransferase domain
MTETTSESKAASTVFDFLSPLAFELPDWRPDSAWTEHGPFAAWLVETLRPRLIVELGSAGGYSFAAFCRAIKACKLDTRAIAIDTWKGDAHSGFYTDELHRSLKTHVDANYAGFAELRRMTFAEALPDVADHSVDLLHVDGRHFYADVVEDYTSWIPKLSDRAVVLFHDTQVQDRGFGVYKYWAELASAHPHFEFLHCNGLGVLALGRRIPPAIARLTAADLDPVVRDQIRNAYGRLGAGVEGLRVAEKRKTEKAASKAWRRAPVGTLVSAVKAKLKG